MVQERSYLTLGPDAFYSFSPELAGRKQEESAIGPKNLEELRSISLTDGWESAFHDRGKVNLEALLPGYIKGRRWFGAKAREIKGLSVTEVIPVPLESGNALMALLNVEYGQGDNETYALPFSFATGAEADRVLKDSPQLVAARLQLSDSNERGILFDATGNSEFGKILLEAISHRRHFKGRRGDLQACSTHALGKIQGNGSSSLEPSISGAEQSNTALIFGDRLILKLFRRLDEGTNPDLEIGRFLTDRGFPHIAPLAGWLEYRRHDGEVRCLGILNGYLPNARDAWEYTLDALSRFYERAQSLLAEAREAPAPTGTLLKLAGQEPSAEIAEAIGTYMESARLLGERTAALHLALASDPSDKDFAPEAFTAHYQRSLYQSMRNLARENLQLLRRQLRTLPEETKNEAQKVLNLEPEIAKRLRSVFERSISAQRIRCHGDYHLGQLLYTGKDFVILDFEGEPARSLSERRIKRSPLRDVAGMLRSFHYAAYVALSMQIERGRTTPENLHKLEPWAKFWHLWVSAIYLKAYLKAAAEAGFLPRAENQLKILLDSSLLEKAAYELGYELNHRPAWVKIPLRGILQLMEGGVASS